jgi:predicted dehydrogenase
VVLGFGSIGRRHSQALERIGACLAIVNRGAPARRAALDAHPAARIAPTLDALDETGFPWFDAAAVVASLGPSHAEHVRNLLERGVRRILCEKPMASSVFDAAEMARRAENDAQWFGINHTLRYARLCEGLEAVAAANGLGPVGSLLVEGGAACLATNGIHWLDFACQAFGAEPKSVVSTASGLSINPRSPNLAMWGGTAIWDFGQGREAVISLNNGSSVVHETRVFYRDAVAELRYVPTLNDAVVHLRLLRRDKASVDRFPAVTRTGSPRERILEGSMDGVRSFGLGLEAAAVELLGGREPTCPARRGVVAVSAIVGALVASREGRSVTLPIHPESVQGRESWPIS